MMKCHAGPLALFVACWSLGLLVGCNSSGEAGARPRPESSDASIGADGSVRAQDAMGAADMGATDWGAPLADGGDTGGEAAGDANWDAGSPDASVDDTSAGLPDGTVADGGGPPDGTDTDLPTEPLAPLITEFQASNQETLDDEDGNSSDWIELYNPHPVTIALGGFHLTDKATKPAKWTFPNMALESGAFLVVFASGKDHADADAPLHTNFKLTSDGEYLALVSPLGTVVSEWSPFPPQHTDVSFGLPFEHGEEAAVSAGQSVEYTVATPSSVMSEWKVAGFDATAAGWLSGQTGLGFELAPATTAATVVADSEAEFSGIQGQSGWAYGYWEHSANGGEADVYDPLTDFIYFPAADAPYGPENYWNGSAWAWPDGSPPWTALNASGGAPNGSNSGPIHTVIRRWTSEISGPATLSGVLNNPSGAGDGVEGQIWVDGTLVFSKTVNGQSATYSVNVFLEAGSAVDFGIGPGPSGLDQDDGTVFTGVVTTGGVTPDSVPSVPPSVPALADSVDDWSPIGEQGAKGWTYGYYNRSQDPDGIYAADEFEPFPHDGGGFSATDLWTGSMWDWFMGNPPWTTVGQSLTHPNGINSGDEHWAIRRYQVPLNGPLLMAWHVKKLNSKGTGVTGHAFHNGAPIDLVAVAGDDMEGAVRMVMIPEAAAGDVIDIALDPTGPSGDPHDGQDSSAVRVTFWAWPDLNDQIATDVGALMAAPGPAAGLLMRAVFEVDDPTAYTGMRLRIKVDDGFAAWLNGQPLAALNAPDALPAEATATAAQTDAQASVFQEFQLPGGLELLQVGENVLAIHALNVAADDSDLLVLPELVLESDHVVTAFDRYFDVPTPGQANGEGTTAVGPKIESVTRGVLMSTNAPTPLEAVVSPTVAPVGLVTLDYRVMFGGEVELVMADDGVAPDLVAGDGVYSVALPAGVAAEGELVRWAVTAADVEGVSSRSPRYVDPIDGERYHGGMVLEEPPETALPVFYWFVANPAAAGTNAGTDTALFYQGELYDNVRADIHGQSTKGFPKKSYNLDFPRDHRFLLSPELPRMKDINLLTNWADKSRMRNTLAYEVYAEAGAAYHLAFPVRVHQNAAFFGVYDFVEDGDDRWLGRIGLDPEGALYKMYDKLVAVSKGEKKTRKDEGKADLQALIDGTLLTGEAQSAFVYDNLDVPGMVNYLAAMIITGGRDCCHKNYYAYRDTRGTGEWTYLPWDVDLTFGRHWNKSDKYFDDVLHPDTPLYVGSNNHLIGLLFQRPEFVQMYLRRLRTLMDQQVQPPETPLDQLKFEQRSDALLAELGQDAWDDAAAWTTWGVPQTPTEALAALKDDYLGPRRSFLYEELGANGGPIPGPPPAPGAAGLAFGVVDPGDTPLEGYLQLMNLGTAAVDLSGWELEGDVHFIFRPGTVLWPGGVVYVVADVNAFRARVEPPTGGMGLFVQGPWQGALDGAPLGLTLFGDTQEPAASL